MALKEDVDSFKGKRKLKYEMRSYQEMVVNQIRQMSKDNYQLLWLKNRVAEQQRHVEVLEESNTMYKEKLQMVTRDMDILRSKANVHHGQTMEEMQFLEQFYEDKIRNLESGNDKDGDFDEIKSGQEQELVNIQDTENETQEVAEIPRLPEREEITKPEIARERASASSEFSGRPGEKPVVSDYRSMFEMSWKDLAIPVLSASIPILLKIIR
ncbi:protein SUPPRESSOR OF GENE SILENCING 3 [Jatropha curcas]|uniref:protein SUPPRESSOR OF GENE SILENCING 3 n=1 Tax=Jatropha curcas TaxID=180498 RepID=UPI001893D157|nr:protein SUPPRESSOR OF GENE SILENCING 3 [Jatropha curcas]